MKPKLFAVGALILLACAFLLVGCFGSSEEVADLVTDSPIASDTASTTDHTAKETNASIDPLQEDTVAPLAVVSTRSLRVRDDPSEEGKVIYALKERESYDVLGISADGKYLELEIPQAPGGTGWVDANFVTVQGDFTNIERGATSSIKLSTSTPASEDEGGANDEAIEDIKDFVSADAKPATVKTNGQRLRVRKEPTADSPIAGRVENGDEVTIIETTADGKWAKISPSGNDNLDGGWVAVEFLVEK